MPGIYRLKGTIKHYDWGGYSFIPSLLQMDNKENRPFAEYWLGAHTNDNCKMELAGKDVLLREYIDRHPEVLGKNVKKKFGQLPFLLKALDVKDMLSIQVHPSKKAAPPSHPRGVFHLPTKNRWANHAVSGSVIASNIPLPQTVAISLTLFRTLEIIVLVYYDK